MLTDCIKKLGKGISSTERAQLEGAFNEGVSKGLSPYDASVAALKDYHKGLFDSVNEVRTAANLPTAEYKEFALPKAPESVAAPESTNVGAAGNAEPRLTAPAASEPVKVQTSNGEVALDLSDPFDAAQKLSAMKSTVAEREYHRVAKLINIATGAVKPEEFPEVIGAAETTPAWAKVGTSRVVDGETVWENKYGGGWRTADGEGNSSPTPEAAVRDSRERLQSSAAIEQSNKSRAETIGRIKSANYNKADIQSISNRGGRVSTSAAQRILMELGLRSTDAREVVKRSRDVGDTANGAILYDLSNVVENARRKGFLPAAVPADLPMGAGAVRRAFEGREPVPVAQAKDAKVTPPEGYVEENGRYVYKLTEPPSPAPPPLTKPTVRPDGSTIEVVDQLPDGTRLEHVVVPFVNKKGVEEKLGHYRIVGPDGRLFRAAEYHDLGEARERLRELDNERLSLAPPETSPPLTKEAQPKESEAVPPAVSPAKGGVSATEPEVARTPLTPSQAAEGGESRPSSNVRRMTVNGEERAVELSPEQAAKWDQIDKELAQSIASAKYKNQMGFVGQREMEQLIKGYGMRASAEKRALHPDFATAREATAAARRERGNYIGKPVSVEGQDATVVANPFGRVKVKFEDGTTRTVDADQVGAKPAEVPKVAPLPPAKPNEPARITAMRERLAKNPPTNLADFFKSEKGEFDPQQLIDYLSVHGYDLYQSGKTKVDEWKQEMRDRFGERAEPYLDRAWANVSGTRETSEVTSTAAKKAAVDVEREARGAEPLPWSPETKADEQLLADAKAANAARPSAPLELARSIVDKQRTRLSDTETVQIDLYKQDLKNEQVELYRQLADETDPEKMADINARIDDTDALYDIADRAWRKSGTENARALRAHQITIDPDLNLINIKAGMKRAKGRDLTAEEKQQAVDWDNERKSLKKQIDEAEERGYTKALQKQIDEAARRQQRQAERGARKVSLDQEAAVIRSNIAAELARIKSSGVQPSGLAGLDPEGKLTKEILKYVRNRAEAKVGLKAEELIDEIHGMVSDLGATRRQVAEAVSGYNAIPQDRRSEVTKQVAEWKAELQRSLAAEDIAAGRRTPKPAGPPRPPAAGPKLSEGTGPTEGPRGPVSEAANTRRQRQLQARIDDAEQQLKSGVFKQPLKREPIVYNRETNALKEKLGRLDRQILGEMDKRAPKSLTDYLVKWKRFGVLGYTSTLAKLVGAAGTRIATTPIEELVGTGIAKAIPSVGRGATREGHFSARAEAKAISQLWQSDTFRDIWSQLKTGKDSLDILYGDKRGEAEFLNLPGRVHGALKTVAKRSEFFRAFETGLTEAARVGKDISQPEVQMSVAMDAYNEARRAIFMQPNAISDTFNKGLANLDRMGKVGHLAANVGRFVFPITRVPVNYIGELSSYVPPIGVTKGLVQIALAKGTERMTPEQRNYTIRAWKKGGVGLGLMALGWFNPSNFGGYYQGKNDKRSKSEAQVGEMMFFGHRIPKAFSHTPFLEAMQVGATMRRAYDAAVAKNKEDESPALEVVKTTTLGMASEIPFVETPRRILQASETQSGIKKYAGGEVKSLIPGVVQEAARKLDTGPSGETVQRRQTGFTDTLKEGIPGLRQTIPISPVFSTKASKGSDEVQRLGIRLMGAMRSPNESADEYKTRRAKVNPEVGRQIDALVGDPSYAKLGEEDKRKAVHAVIDQVNDAYRKTQPQKPRQAQQARRAISFSQ